MPRRIKKAPQVERDFANPNAGFFAIIADKVDKITNQELGAIILIAVLFVGAVLFLAYNKVESVMVWIVLVIFFLTTEGFVFCYVFLPKSIRQEEFRQDAKQMRETFKESLPKVTLN